MAKPPPKPAPEPGATLLAARRAQGLPDHITDPVVLEQIARALLPAARRAKQRDDEAADR